MMPHPLGEWVGFRHEEGRWNLPGGMVEPGENPRFTALRETVEEVGIIPPHLVFLGVIHHQVLHKGSLVEVRAHAFFSRMTAEKVEPTVLEVAGNLLHHYSPSGVTEEMLVHPTHGRFPQAVKEAFRLLRLRDDLLRFWAGLSDWRSDSKPGWHK